MKKYIYIFLLFIFAYQANAHTSHYAGIKVINLEIFKDGEELVDEPFERLIRQGQLISYMYDGFWKNIDNYKDKIEIDEMYEKNNSPWILWED